MQRAEHFVDHCEASEYRFASLSLGSEINILSTHCFAITTVSSHKILIFHLGWPSKKTSPSKTQKISHFGGLLGLFLGANAKGKLTS